MMVTKADDLGVYEGAMAITREGLVGIVMGIEDKKLAVDGEATSLDDLRLVPAEASNEKIMALAAELGLADIEAQNAVVESVRLLREKTATTKDSPAEENAEEFDYDVRKQAGFPDLSEELKRVNNLLEEERAARKKADDAAIEAASLMNAALEDAAAKDLELRKLRKSIPTPNPSPLHGEGKDKPYGAKIIPDTTEERCEILWEDGWELMQSQFNGDGRLQTLWRKINEFYRPDGSPLYAQKMVALPTFEETSMETEGNAEALLLAEAGAVIYGSENAIPTPDPSPLHGEGNLKDADVAIEAVVEAEIEVMVSAPVEILPADVFPRFDDDILNELPISQAILKHGVEAVKAMGDMAAVTAAADVLAMGNPLAKLEIKQFSNALPSPAGV